MKKIQIEIILYLIKAILWPTLFIVSWMKRRSIETFAAVFLPTRKFEGVSRNFFKIVSLTWKEEKKGISIIK